MPGGLMKPIKVTPEQIEFEEVQELSETERGTKGYGSSGS